MDQNILNKLTKIKALVERGEQGERKAAEQALQNLLSKYNISIEDLENEEIKGRSFHVMPADWFIFTQIKVHMFYKRSLWQSKKKSWYIIDMTQAEFIEFSAMFDFHKNQYKKEIDKITDSFKSAYVHKHDMFWKGDKDDVDKSRNDVSLEEIERVRGLMGMLEDASFRKSIQ